MKGFINEILKTGNSDISVLKIVLLIKVQEGLEALLVLLHPSSHIHHILQLRPVVLSS